ncbi:MAG TPA: diaminopimelate epimerase [Kofleriaceae bacterium]|nr:diaminopimelate epimerase [Kofleriaceae bacterium]
MRFAKYQGLGNDFLVVDLRAAPAAEAALAQDPQHVIALCDRQFGVGGDGVLAVLPSKTADARMRVLNSDGSEAEMCGNGIRCVAKELFDRGGLARPELAIETGAGVLVCSIEAEGGVARSVTVAMGAPRLLRGEIPVSGPSGERCIEQPLALPGAPTGAPTGALALTCVSMGNPHAVAFIGSLDEAWRLAKSIGPTVEHHAWFPNRTNVELAHARSPREIDLVVWERGCGITLACGTGACATTVAAVLTGRAAEATPVRVNLPGGALEITVLAGMTNVLMKGPAAHVFDGDIDPARLARRP